MNICEYIHLRYFVSYFLCIRKHPLTTCNEFQKVQMSIEIVAKKNNQNYLVENRLASNKSVNTFLFDKLLLHLFFKKKFAFLVNEKKTLFVIS